MGLPFWPFWSRCAPIKLTGAISYKTFGSSPATHLPAQAHLSRRNGRTSGQRPRTLYVTDSVPAATRPNPKAHHGLHGGTVRGHQNPRLGRQNPPCPAAGEVILCWRCRRRRSEELAGGRDNESWLAGSLWSLLNTIPTPSRSVSRKLRIST